MSGPLLTSLQHCEAASQKPTKPASRAPMSCCNRSPARFGWSPAWPRRILVSSEPRRAHSSFTTRSPPPNRSTRSTSASRTGIIASSRGSTMIAGVPTPRSRRLRTGTRATLTIFPRARIGPDTAPSPTLGPMSSINTPSQPAWISAPCLATRRPRRQAALRSPTHPSTCKGSLEPGKLADLVVLSQDPLTCELAVLRDTVAEMTIVNGEIVFDRTKN